MTAHFQELQLNSGVDHSYPPVMMIPLPAEPKRAGFNFVRLVGGDGYDLSTNHRKLKVEDLNPQLGHVYNMMERWPLIGPAVGASKASLHNRRLLKVSCDVTLGKQGGKLLAKSKGKPSQVATIDVVVLRQRKIRLAILQVKLPDGKLLSRKPADAKALCDALNKIWTPQANIFFDLVSDDQVPVDLPTDEGFRLQPDKYLSLFTKVRPPAVDFTIFLVRNVGTLVGNVWNVAVGRTISDHAIAFVADSGRGLPDEERTIAHEAGHWLGAFDKMGNWIRYPDNHETRPTHLMTQGSYGLKLSLRETDKVSPNVDSNKGVLERFNWNY